MEPTKRPKTFQRGSGCYECRKCKKQTRETGEGESQVKLCRKCYDEAGYECDHLDGNHATEKWPAECPLCRPHDAKDCAGFCDQHQDAPAQPAPQVPASG